MITENLSTLKINKLSQEQYDRELEAGNIDENALYLTPDEIKFNKVLCDSGNISVSVLTDDSVEIPEINNYSIFIIYISGGSSQHCCAVLCTKSRNGDTEYITGFNNFISSSSSGNMFFRFKGSIQETTLTDVVAQWTNSLYQVDVSGDNYVLADNNWVDATVSKIIGVV